MTTHQIYMRGSDWKRGRVSQRRARGKPTGRLDKERTHSDPPEKLETSEVSGWAHNGSREEQGEKEGTI